MRFLVSTGIIAILGHFALVLGQSIKCYKCEGEDPYCPGDKLQICEKHDDKCVKISMTQTSGPTSYIQNCLSTIHHMKGDIPRDQSIGCRPAEPPDYIQVGVPTMRPDDSTLSPDTMYCFCNTADECNEAHRLFFSPWILTISVLLMVIKYN